MGAWGNEPFENDAALDFLPTIRAYAVKYGATDDFVNACLSDADLLEEKLAVIDIAARAGLLTDTEKWGGAVGEVTEELWDGVECWFDQAERREWLEDYEEELAEAILHASAMDDEGLMKALYQIAP